MGRKSIVVIALVVGVGFVAVWLFGMGNLSHQFSSSDNTDKEVDASVRICDASSVYQYNGVTLYTFRQGSSEASIDKAGVDSLLSNIKSKTGFENDPTCQTIIFWEAVRNNDYTSALSAYKLVSVQHEKGVFAEKGIRGDQPFSSYRSYIDSLSDSPAALSSKDKYVDD